LDTGALVATITGFKHPNNCDVGGDLLVTTDPVARLVTVHHIPDLTRVAVFDQNFVDPQGVAVLHENGRPLAYITDVTPALVKVYDLTTFSQVPVRTFPIGFASGEGIAADDLYQRVIIGDGLTGRVRAFTSTGTLVSEFGKPAIDADAEGVAVYR